MSLTETNGISVRRVFARRLYNGLADQPECNQLVEIEYGRITAVRSAAPGEWLDSPEADIVAPGFIDMQINGAGDTQFNFDPTPEALVEIAKGARKGGTAHLLPTFITAPGRTYLQALAAGRAAIAAGSPGILGVHLEGPFLSPQRPGIHPAAAIRVPTEADITALITPFPGVLMLTLAPECLPVGVLAQLANAGIILAVGHSAASAAEIRAAEAEGLRGTTHLFNAMSQLTGREPGVVGAVLDSPRLFAGIIADGLHVDWRNIALAARLMGKRLCLVTDGMLTLAGESTEFNLYGQLIFRQGDRLANAEGRLAGANVAMDKSVRNLVENVGLPLAEVLRMAATHPAQALRLGEELGKIAPGYRASLSLLNADLSTRGVVVDGSYFGSAD